MAQKRVVVLGTKWWGKWAEQVVVELQSQGYEARLVNIHQLLPVKFYHYWRTKSSFRKWRKDAINRLLQDVICDWKPDYLFSINVDIVSPDTFLLLKENKIRSFIWLGDSPYSFCYRDFASYDVVAIWDRYYVSILSYLINKPVEYLPTCGDSNTFKPLKQSGDIDLIFIGSAFGENGALRSSVIGGLLQRLDDTDFTVRIYGNPRWKDYFNAYPVLERYFIDRIVTPAEANQLYNRSKIALNVDHPQNITSTCARTYELALAGVFQLCNHKDAIADSLFPDNRMVLFGSMDDLVEKTRYYLRNEDERVRLAKRACQHAIENHTYKQRVATIFALLNSVS